MTHKQQAHEFLRLAAAGQAKEAFRLYVGDGFIHHNAYFKGDGHTLMTAMDESAKANPDTNIVMLRSLEDGDLVAVHSHVTHIADEPGYVVMHIFRFVNDKIMELWDFGQAIPTDLVNEHGML